MKRGWTNGSAAVPVLQRHGAVRRSFHHRGRMLCKVPKLPRFKNRVSDSVGVRNVFEVVTEVEAPSALRALT